MVTKLIITWALMAVCVAIHAGGVTAAMGWMRRRSQRGGGFFWQTTWSLVCVAGWMVFLHLIEIAAWAFFYTWGKAMPDLATALYFSAVTYTTTGYGDVVPPEAWRLVGGVEALTGILMCGWSTGFFFAVVSQMHRSRGGEPPAR